MAGPNSTPEAKAKSLANLDAGRMDWSTADPEIVREIKSAGGKAVQEQKKRAKDIKSIYAYLLDMDAGNLIPEELAEKAQELAQERNQALSLYEAIALAQAAKAATGDTSAAVFVRDSAGDKPTDKQQITGLMTEGDALLMDKMKEKLQQKDI